jgi:hypothetical protein
MPSGTMKDQLSRVKDHYRASGLTRQVGASGRLGCFVLGRPRKRGLAPAGLGQVPVPVSEADRVALSKPKGTATVLRTGVSDDCLLAENPGSQHCRADVVLTYKALRCAREPVPFSEADRVALGQTKGTGTSLRSGASPPCLAQSENETALPGLPSRYRRVVP